MSKVVRIHTIPQRKERPHTDRVTRARPHGPRRASPVTITQRAVEETAEMALDPAQRAAFHKRDDAEVQASIDAMKRQMAEIEAERELAERNPELAKKVQEIEAQLAYRQSVRLLREAAAVHVWYEQHAPEWSERKRAQMAEAMDVISAAERELVKVFLETDLARVHDPADDLTDPRED